MDMLASFRQALETLAAELAEAEVERSRAEQQLQACERRIESLRAEHRGIESYLRRHDLQNRADREIEPEVPTIADGWDINRVEAVARVLTTTGETLSPGDIVDKLAAVGRNDTMKDVAAALSHLKKRHRAVNVSRGLWAATTEALERAWVGDTTSPVEDEKEEIAPS
jgi:chromosome segregation ATPase